MIPPRDLIIDRHGAAPVYRQIYDQFRAALAAGTLKPGDRVPSARGLASRLGAARGTVEEAYQLLASEGYLTRRGQAGTVVSPELPALRGTAIPPIRAPAHSTAPITAPTAAAGSFALGVPAFDAFPRKLWARISSSEGRRLGEVDLAHPDPAGHPDLRLAIAQYLALARGIACDWQDVVVTSGYQGALAVLLPLLLREGDRVLLEDPGYLPARHAVAASPGRIVPVAVDDAGMRVAEGIAAAPDARLAIVTPSHHSPTGTTLALPRRLALLAWAAANDTWIIEDDYDGEFHYTGRLLPALKSLDGGQHVIYVGTFSKTLFPALRLGYMVLPERLRARVRSAMAVHGAGQATMAQRIVARFMREGHFAKHLRRMRTLYRARRQALTEGLHAIFADTLDIAPRDGGMHIIAHIKGGTPDIAWAEAARRHGITVQALSRHAIGPGRHNALVLGFTNMPAEHALARCRELREAVGALAGGDTHPHEW